MPTPPAPSTRTPEQQFERFRQHADAGALAAVFDAVAPELLLVAAHLAPQATDAEDLVQATFVDAIEQRARWDGARPLVPWLIGILANHARQARRKAAQVPDPTRLRAESATGAAPSAHDEAAAREVGERIAAAVQGLPRQYRQVLTLRLVHGLSPTAIAHALGCPVATAKTRLQRGMEWLRKALPPGLAASAVLTAMAGRGLAAVRAAVLARAADLAPLAAAGAAAAAAAFTIGGLAMKKTLLAAVAALLVLTGWLAIDPPRDDVDTPLGTARGPVVAGQVAAPTALPTATADDAPAPPATTRTAANPDAAATLGSVDLQFVWRGLDRPASNLRVWAKSPDEARRWQADRDGRIRCADLPPGDWFLSGRTLWHGLTIDAAATTEARIEVEPTMQFEGLVVDARGRPVAGADVLVQYYPDSSDRAPRLVARSGPDGTFAAATDWGGAVWAHADGFAPSPVTELADHGLDPGQTLRLELGDGVATVRGRVTCDDGPAARAELLAVRTDPPYELGAPLSTRADDDGRFELTGLRAGQWLLVAAQDGFAPTPRAIEVEPGIDPAVQLHLHRGAVVHGTVRRTDGAALAGRVVARPGWAGGGRRFSNALRPVYHRYTGEVAIAADGSYRLAGLPAGPLEVEVTAGDEPLRDQRLVEVTADGELRCDFELATATRVRGTAVDAAGAPLVGWVVSASPEGGGYMRAARVDDDGAFELSGMEAPAYTIELHPDRDADSPRVLWLRRTGVRPQDGELHLALPCAHGDGASIRGSVRLADGSVPPAATLLLTAGENAPGQALQLRLDEGGAFAAHGLPPGDYRVRLHLGLRANLLVGPRQLPPGGDVDLGALRVPVAGTLEVRLRRADGRDAMPLELRAIDLAGNRGEFEPGPGGVHRSAPLPAGTYRVRAWGADFAPVEQELTVVADRVSASVLTVVDAAPVAFAFALEGEGQGGDRPPIELVLRDGDGARIGGGRAPTDADGRGSWTRGLPAGEYTWEARTLPAGAPRRGTFRVPPVAGDTVAGDTVGGDTVGGDPVRVDATLPRAP
ncbi:MAG: sigma-70 family RNA polymerase sigma factor [Planctomycetota bacterium]